MSQSIQDALRINRITRFLWGMKVYRRYDAFLANNLNACDRTKSQIVVQITPKNVVLSEIDKFAPLTEISAHWRKSKQHGKTYRAAL